LRRLQDMVAAYAATPSPPAPTGSTGEPDEAKEAAEPAEGPEVPGAPEVGHADDPKNAGADHQFEGEEYQQRVTGVADSYRPPLPFICRWDQPRF
jgi:hypothetical protein